MRFIKFIVFLLVLFCAAFFWAGGKIPVPKAIATGIDATVDTVRSIHSFIDFKSTVNSKLKRDHYVSLADIPLTMQQAIIAVEDRRFYNHWGFDIEGILRATLVNLQNGTWEEGGSTITQQLAKNLFLSPDRTLVRKAQELALALLFESIYTKEEILEMYLNTIYFGAGAYGIGEAAEVYFGKQPKDLSLAEAALLAGLPQAPSIYSPYADLAAARERQAVVLAAMVRQGIIGPGQAKAAQAAPLAFAKRVQ